jgi:hypothetical protein
LKVEESVPVLEDRTALRHRRTQRMSLRCWSLTLPVAASANWSVHHQPFVYFQLPWQMEMQGYNINFNDIDFITALMVTNT